MLMARAKSAFGADDGIRFQEVIKALAAGEGGRRR
jgi:hypothetical protein